MMPSEALQALRRRLPRRAWFIAAGTGLGLYTLAGFFGVPWLVRRQAPPKVQALLGQTLRLGKVHFNPFTFQLVLEDVALLNPAGQELAGFDRLAVDLEAWSLPRREITLQDLSLEGLRAHLVLEKNGRSNLTDLLEHLKAAQGTAPEPASAKPERGLHIVRLHIGGARALFEDRSGEWPYQTMLGPYALDLHHLRTLGGASGQSAFTARTAAGEGIQWQGTLDLDRFQSQGRLQLTALALATYAPYIHSQFPIDLQKGRLDVAADYRFALEKDQPQLHLSGGTLRLQDLALAESGRPRATSPRVEVGSLSVEGLEGSLAEATWHIRRVGLQGGRTTLAREADGRIDLPRLFVPRHPKPKDTKTPDPRLTLDALEVQGHALAFEDRTQATPARLGLNVRKVSLQDLTLDPAHRSALQAELQVDGGGTLQVQGQVQPLKAIGDLKVQVSDLSLPTFQPFLGTATTGSFASGSLDATLQVAFSALDPKGPQVEAQGHATVARLRFIDPDKDPVVAWDAMDLQGIQARLSPLKLHATTATLAGPTFHLIVNADLSTSVAKLFAAPPAPAAGTGAGTNTGHEPPPDLVLGEFRMERGRVVFQDRSVSPRASLDIRDLQLRSRNLSLDPAAVVGLEVSAKVDGAMPLTAKGRFNLFQPAADADLELHTRGMDLLSLGPYVGKYLGYTLTKGQLDLDLGWHVKARQLSMQNHIRLAPFTLGERVDSPDAIHAPVKLGLAILRNRQGVIPVDLPIEGNLDAPDFRLRKIVFYALTNVLVKSATAPFDALGRLFGGGADLSQAPFEPGRAVPATDGRTRLASLQKALEERPGLTLEITGRSGPDDEAALRKRMLEIRLARVLGQDPDVPLAPERRADALRRLWEQEHPAPPVPKGSKAARPPKDAPPLPQPEAIEKEWLAKLVVDPQELVELASRRAQAVREHLLAAGLPPERLVRAASVEPLAYVGVTFKLQ